MSKDSNIILTTRNKLIEKLVINLETNNNNDKKINIIKLHNKKKAKMIMKEFITLILLLSFRSRFEQLIQFFVRIL